MHIDDEDKTLSKSYWFLDAEFHSLKQKRYLNRDQNQNLQEVVLTALLYGSKIWTIYTRSPFMVVKPRQSTAEMLGCFTQNAFEKNLNIRMQEKIPDT